MGNSLGNSATKPELEEEWNRLCFSGEIKSLDRLVLKAVFDNPGATTREIAEDLGCDHSVVVRRLNRPAVIKARQLFEGTFSDQMHAAAGKFARWINKTLEMADQSPSEAAMAILTEMPPETAEPVIRATLSRMAPQIVLDAGKVAVGFLAKEAELQLKAKEAGQAKPVAPMSVAAARSILDADFAVQPDEPVIVEDL